MKILIVEDDPIKLKRLSNHISQDFPLIEVSIKMSYTSALKSILKENYHLVLLDMQLPNYDIKSGEDGYIHRPLAGRDILKEIKRKKINTKVIIITQYDTFGEDGNYASLEQWDNSLSEDFSNLYLKMIFYDPSSSAWKIALKDYLNPLI